MSPRAHLLDMPLLGQGVLGRHLLALAQRLGPGDFHSLRDYVDGDEPRTIHWRASARSENLKVRQHSVEGLQRCVVLLDQHVAPGPAGEESFERAVTAAASVVHSADRAGLTTRFVTTDGADLRVPDVAATTLHLLARIVDQRPADGAGRARPERGPRPRRVDRCRSLGGVVDDARQGPGADPDRRLHVDLRHRAPLLAVDARSESSFLQGWGVLAGSTRSGRATRPTRARTPSSPRSRCDGDGRRLAPSGSSAGRPPRGARPRRHRRPRRPTRSSPPSGSPASSPIGSSSPTSPSWSSSATASRSCCAASTCPASPPCCSPRSALVWAVAWVSYPDTFAAIFPTRETWDIAWADLGLVRDQFQDAVAPVEYVGGWSLLAAIGTAFAVLTADTFAFHARARGEALVPGAVLFVFVAALGADRHRIGLTLALVAAGFLDRGGPAGAVRPAAAHVARPPPPPADGDDPGGRRRRCRRRPRPRGSSDPAFPGRRPIRSSTRATTAVASPRS